ncbi:MAG: hypothetical protein U1C49_01215 [Candidatus Andersenbacteria bacterium]|nr:hypothetical protein [bacterium]MDZ4225445.1 hypothetical protein [Candidatus Andersenbacteria bacterium]
MAGEAQPLPKASPFAQSYGGTRSAGEAQPSPKASAGEASTVNTGAELAVFVYRKTADLR